MVEPEDVERMLRTLVRITGQQEVINQDLRICIQEQREFNRQQVEINTAVKTTLARLETLVARMIRPGENGREA
jgi:hypothetical protein